MSEVIRTLRIVPYDNRSFVVDRIELHADGTFTTGDSGVGAGWLATATRLEDGDQAAGFAYLAANGWSSMRLIVHPDDRDLARGDQDGLDG
jgi:hypothetical protein